MIVVDTNVLSELMRPAPDPSVVAWARQHTGRDLATTAITVAEILHGIERLPTSRRRAALRDAATDVFTTFADRVFSFDAAAALHYPVVVHTRDGLGLPIDGFDAQIASICRAHDARLATRNTRDFQHTGLELIDPWR